MASLDDIEIGFEEQQQEQNQEKGVNMAHSVDEMTTSHTGQDDPKNAKEILSELSDKFHNFDDPHTYEVLMNDALRETTANFAVRFGVDKSEIAVNLNEQDLGALLQVQADEKNDMTTWM